MTHQGYMLHVVLKRRQNAKRLTMRVRDGEVHATAPASLKTQEAEAFIAQHFDWIKNNLITMPQPWRNLKMPSLRFGIAVF